MPLSDLASKLKSGLTLDKPAYEWSLTRLTLDKSARSLALPIFSGSLGKTAASLGEISLDRRETPRLINSHAVFSLVGGGEWCGCGWGGLLQYVP